jgi:hypothetical protein
MGLDPSHPYAQPMPVPPELDVQMQDATKPGADGQVQTMEVETMEAGGSRTKVSRGRKGNRGAAGGVQKTSAASRKSTRVVKKRGP